MEREARMTLAGLPVPSVESASFSRERKLLSLPHDTVQPHRPEPEC